MPKLRLSKAEMRILQHCRTPRRTGTPAEEKPRLTTSPSPACWIYGRTPKSSCRCRSFNGRFRRRYSDGVRAVGHNHLRDCCSTERNRIAINTNSEPLRRALLAMKCEPVPDWPDRSVVHNRSSCSWTCACPRAHEADPLRIDLQALI
jgi:hypothetical protein